MDRISIDKTYGGNAQLTVSLADGRSFFGALGTREIDGRKRYVVIGDDQDDIPQLEATSWRALIAAVAKYLRVSGASAEITNENADVISQFTTPALKAVSKAPKAPKAHPLSQQAQRDYEDRVLSLERQAAARASERITQLANDPTPSRLSAATPTNLVPNVEPLINRAAEEGHARAMATTQRSVPFTPPKRTDTAEMRAHASIGLAAARTAEQEHEAARALDQAASRVSAVAAVAVNEAANDAQLAVAAKTGSAVLWMSERNACVHCLSRAGAFQSSDGTFGFGPHGDFAAKAFKLAGPLTGPPLHPHCRCTVLVGTKALLNSVADAEAREAARAILRGDKLASESSRLRVEAARKLLAEGGGGLPTSVVKRAQQAVKRGAFADRSGLAKSRADRARIARQGSVVLVGQRGEAAAEPVKPHAKPIALEGAWHVTTGSAEALARNGFDQDKATGGAAYWGAGVYFSPDAKSRDRVLERWKEDAAWLKRKGLPGGREDLNAVQADLSTLKLFEVDYNTKDVGGPNSAMLAAMRKAGVEFDDGGKGWLEPDEVRKALQRAGYDGVLVRPDRFKNDTTFGDEIVVFDVKDIHNVREKSLTSEPVADKIGDNKPAAKEPKMKLSDGMVKGLEWVAREDHGAFTNGLGFTRTTLDGLRKRGLVAFDREAMEAFNGRKVGGYEYNFLKLTDAGRAWLAAP